MKKLIALLAAASLLSVGLCSCGDSDKDDEKKKDSSSKVSDSADDEDEDEDEDEDDSKDKKKDKNKDKNKDKDKDDEEDEEEVEEDDEDEEDEEEEEDKNDKKDKNKDKDKGNSKSDSDIVGMWENDEMADEADFDSAGFTFNKDGSVSVFFEMSSQFSLHKDGSIDFSGMNIEAENIDFDGETFLLSYEGMDLIEMTKYEKSDASDFDGTYKLEGGLLTDSFAEAFASEYDTDVSIDLTFEGQRTYLSINDFMSYSVSGDKITLNNFGAFFDSDFESAEGTYTIDGDTLTIEADGETLEFTRAK